MLLFIYLFIVSLSSSLLVCFVILVSFDTWPLFLQFIVWIRFISFIFIHIVGFNYSINGSYAIVRFF